MNRNLLIGIIVLAVAGAVSYFIIFGDAGKSNLFSSQVPANAPVGEDLPVVTVFYTTPLDWAEYGNFSFQYPSALALKKYGVERIGLERRHVVTLVAMNQFNSTTTNDFIEINFRKGEESCSFYDECRIVEGITIGTNTKDSRVLNYFDEIIKGFKVNQFSSPPLN